VSHSPYILGDTTRSRHIAYVLVWSKSDQRRLRKTLHKQTNKQTNKQTDRQTDRQTNRHYENNGHLAMNQKLECGPMPNVMTALLFNVAKFGWRPLIVCRAVTLPRRETSWNLLGCPKLVNGSQTLVGRSSSYCEDVRGRYIHTYVYFSKRKWWDIAV